MTGHRAENPPVRGRAGAWRPALTVLLLMAAGCLAITVPGEAHASATLAPRDHDPVNSRNGNGRDNNNFSAVNSPTNMTGTQQVAISISRWTNTQLAFCKRRTHNCTISQNISKHR